MTEPLHVKYNFTVEKVQTRPDNSIRIYIDLPETQIPQAMLFMDGARRGVAFRGVADEANLHEITQNDRLEA